MNKCSRCGSIKEIQKHHISYEPPVIIELCRTCHIKQHQHGTGVTNWVNSNYTVKYGDLPNNKHRVFAVVKKLIHVGLSQAVIIPKAWLTQYPNIESILLDVENNEITITPVVAKK